MVPNLLVVGSVILPGFPSRRKVTDRIQTIVLPARTRLFFPLYYPRPVSKNKSSHWQVFLCFITIFCKSTRQMFTDSRHNTTSHAYRTTTGLDWSTTEPNSLDNLLFSDTPIRVRDERAGITDLIGDPRTSQRYWWSTTDLGGPTKLADRSPRPYS